MSVHIEVENDGWMKLSGEGDGVTIVANAMGVSLANVDLGPNYVTIRVLPVMMG